MAKNCFGLIFLLLLLKIGQSRAKRPSIDQLNRTKAILNIRLNFFQHLIKDRNPYDFIPSPISVSKGKIQIIPKFGNFRGSNGKFPMIEIKDRNDPYDLIPSPIVPSKSKIQIIPMFGNFWKMFEKRTEKDSTTDYTWVNRIRRLTGAMRGSYPARLGGKITLS